MMEVNVDLLNRFFARLIWESLAIHEDDKRCMCSLYFKLESIVVPIGL
jgi:hypothetical protein